MKYRYEGFNKVGSIKRGTIDADNIGRAAEMLREQGIFAQQLEQDDGTQMKTILGATDHEPEPQRSPEFIPAGPPAPLPETKIMNKNAGPKFACSTVAGLSSLVAERGMRTWQEDLEEHLNKITEMYNYKIPKAKKKKDQIPDKIIAEARDLAAKEAIKEAFLRALEYDIYYPSQTVAKEAIKQAFLDLLF